MSPSSIMQNSTSIISNLRAGGRQFNGGRNAGRTPLGRMGAQLAAEKTRELLTVNGHGICPVYCIKFDQTGQYIFTGADDGLVKVRGRGVRSNEHCEKIDVTSPKALP